MSNQLAIEILLEKREKLQQARIEFMKKSGDEIRELDHSVAALNGGKFILSKETKYDDENPDYIKGTEDGI